MELIVRHESDIVYSLASDLVGDDRHLLDGGELSTESLPYVVWEFVHGVVLNFSIEELSQVTA